MTTERIMIDTGTPLGRKALGYLATPTKRLIELLGLPPQEHSDRPTYTKAELCLMCAERGVKRY